MVEGILCLWFNHHMLSPSPNSSKKAFSRVALVGKFQADGIDEHLRELAKLVSGLGCKVFIEASTATQLNIKDYPIKAAEDLRVPLIWLLFWVAMARC